MGAKKLILLSVFLMGCPGFGDEAPPVLDVPELPEWKRDVLPLMEKYCTECHSVPATQSAPGYFRLDECENADVSGANTMAALNALRTSQLKTMPPPSYPLQPTETEREIFQQWFNTGAPCEGPGVLPNNMPNNPPNNSDNSNNSNNSNNGTNNTTNNVEGAPFDVVAGILATNCGTANCHGQAGGNGNLEIPVGATPEQVRFALAGKNVESASSVYSAGTPFVVPTQPEESAIFLRINSNTAGVRMPPAGNLVDAQIEAIRTWIESGAPYQ